MESGGVRKRLLQHRIRGEKMKGSGPTVERITSVEMARGGRPSKEINSQREEEERKKAQVSMTSRGGGVTQSLFFL